MKILNTTRVTIFIIATTLSWPIFAMRFSPLPTLHHFSRHLILTANQGADCMLALKNANITVDIAYWYNKQLNYGEGAVNVENPTASNPPIVIPMARGGFSDRIVYDHYFNPTIPIFINGRGYGLYAAIFNLCFSGQKQVALELDINPVQHCLMTTATWNYCRG